MRLVHQHLLCNTISRAPTTARGPRLDSHTNLAQIPIRREATCLDPAKLPPTALQRLPRSLLQA